MAQQVAYVFLLLCLGVPTSFAELNNKPHESCRLHKNYGIIGSNITSIRKHPYTVSITYHSSVSYQELRGGGAILNKRWVLCSASQLKTFEANLTVRAGSSFSAAGGQNITVEKLIMHESYVYGFDYNIALLKLSTALKFNRNTKPIRLARFAPKVGAATIVSGFGMRNGDYGDPLVYKRKLVGVFVGGDLCNFFNSLEVYSNIGYYRKWILNKIRNNSLAKEMEGLEDGV